MKKNEALDQGGGRNSKLSAPLPVPFYYGWVVVVLSFLTTLVGAGIRSASTVLIHPLEIEFGWSRAAIASAISLNLLLVGVAAPISGWLLDRYGPRRVMIGSLTLLFLGVGATTVMKEFWQLVLLWGVVVGLGAGGTGSVLAATVAHRWFVARRGLALGILNSAASTGQLIFLPLLMAIFVAAGWRIGSLMMMFVALGLLPLVALWMRDDPGAMGLKPYGLVWDTAPLANQTSPSDVTSALPLASVFKSSTFWLLAGSFFVCGGTSAGLIGTHLIPHSIDIGFPEVAAAAAVGVMGGLNFVGTLFSGWLVDRADARKLLSLVYALRGVSLFVLPFVTDFSGLMIFAVIYGLDWFATVPPTIALAGETFGKESVGSVFGWIFLSHQIGAAATAAASGAVRVWLGDYQLTFLMGGVMALIAAALVLGIRSPQREVSLNPIPSDAVNV